MDIHVHVVVQSCILQIKWMFVSFIQDLSSLLLPSLSPAILRGLRDVDDDVRAVAASALLPVAGKLHHIIPDKVNCWLPVCTHIHNALSGTDNFTPPPSKNGTNIHNRLPSTY